MIEEKGQEFIEKLRSLLEEYNATIQYTEDKERFVYGNGIEFIINGKVVIGYDSLTLNCFDL